MNQSQPGFVRRFSLLVLFVVSFFLSSCGGRVELIAALPESEANEVLAVLLNANIKAEKIPGKEGNVSLQVDSHYVARAIDILRERGLPRERYLGMGDVFKKEGLISSPTEERARYIYALSQELANTLSRIDGVITARVHVVLPEKGSGGDPSQPSSSAVFIKYQDGANLDIVQPQIRRLVTNSIPGLTADKVSVILVASQKLDERIGSAANKMNNVLGFYVDPRSTNSLWATLSVLLVLVLAVAGALGWTIWKFVLPARNQPKTMAMAPSAELSEEEMNVESDEGKS